MVVKILVGILFPFKWFSGRKLFQITGPFNGNIVGIIGNASVAQMGCWSIYDNAGFL